MGSYAAAELKLSCFKDHEIDRFPKQSADACIYRQMKRVFGFELWLHEAQNPTGIRLHARVGLQETLLSCRMGKDPS